VDSDIHPFFYCQTLMASQKLTNCCVAAIALVTAAYLSTPRSSTIARLAFGAFCLAIHSFCFLAKASNADNA
jgi:ABC-type transport system involved in multi-copper enzyme maturation permease subunit